MLDNPLSRGGDLACSFGKGEMRTLSAAARARILGPIFLAADCVRSSKARWPPLGQARRRLGQTEQKGVDMRTFVERAGYRSRRAMIVPPIVGAALLALTAAVALVMAPVSASSNKEPHRMFLAAAPFDLPAGFCDFPVHFEFPVNKEYAKVSTGPDGSTIFKVNGSLFVSLTNTATGKTITVNASGPGTDTFSADGTTLIFDGLGLGLLFAPNLTQFGLPSNIVQTSGPALATIDLTTGAVTSMATQPHVLLDVCAALS
jgi:hypothetical protein